MRKKEVNLMEDLMRGLNQVLVQMRQPNLMVVPKKEVKPAAVLMKGMRH